jgi:uncharacterized membrane protein YgcG
MIETTEVTENFPVYSVVNFDTVFDLSRRTKVKVQYLAVLMSMIIIATMGCGETINSTWKSQEITIDGNGDDWEGLPLQYQEDMNVVYGMVNNENTIDFMIRFNDENLARMFSMRGFALWLNGEDDEEKQIGIYYRDEVMHSKFVADMRKKSRENGNDEKRQPVSVKRTGKFYLANNDTLTSLRLKDIPGFDAAADQNNAVYCFEFSIPLTSETGSPYDLNKFNDGSIKVGLEIVGISEEEKEILEAQMEERRSVMQGGSRGGGRSGGGMKGGRRGGGKRGGGNRPQMPDMDGEDYWISVKLATQ